MNKTLLFEELERKVNEAFIRITHIQNITNEELVDLRGKLSFLAYNLTLKKSVQFDRETGKRIPQTVPNAVKKNMAVAWLFHIPADHKTQRTIPNPTEQEKNRAIQLLRWAEEADLIIQTERLMYFSEPFIEAYFCAHYCHTQALADLLPVAASPYLAYQSKFIDVWPIWAELDQELLASLMNLLASSSEEDIRRNALVAIGQIGFPDTMQLLLKIVKNKTEEANVRIEAIKALGKLDYPPIMEQLISLLKEEKIDSILQAIAFSLIAYDKISIQPLNTVLNEGEVEARHWSAFALSQIGDSAAVTALIEALKDKNELVRDTAAYALGNIGDARAAEPLKSALNDPEPKVRIYAASALENIAGTDAVGILANLLLKETNSSVRWAVMDSLFNIADKRAIPALVVMLNDASSEVREQAAKVLGQIPDWQAVKPLLEKLADREEAIEVRKICAYSVGEIGNQQALEPLRRLLENEKDDEVHKSIYFALVRLGDEQAYQRALELLESDNLHTKLGIINALISRDAPREAKVFIRLLKDTNSQIRAQAAFALQKCTDLRWVEPLIETLDDPNPSVRYNAALALGIIGDKRALPKLQWLVRNDIEKGAGEVRVAADWAIKQILQRD